eukprot:1977803-Amphidinium_carterae.1
MDPKSFKTAADVQVYTKPSDQCDVKTPGRKGTVGPPNFHLSRGMWQVVLVLNATQSCTPDPHMLLHTGRSIKRQPGALPPNARVILGLAKKRSSRCGSSAVSGQVASAW